MTVQETAPAQPKPEDLGLSFCSAPNWPGEPYWQLINLEITMQAQAYAEGAIEWYLIDGFGLPAENIDVLLEWPDGFTCATTDRSGRARSRLWDEFDPVHGHGPCWLSLVEPSTEIHGVGVPAGHSILYQVTYQRKRTQD
jgi:hypothetical protein